MKDEPYLSAYHMLIVTDAMRVAGVKTTNELVIGPNGKPGLRVLGKGLSHNATMALWYAHWAADNHEQADSMIEEISALDGGTLLERAFDNLDVLTPKARRSHEERLDEIRRAINVAVTKLAREQDGPSGIFAIAEGDIYEEVRKVIPNLSRFQVLGCICRLRRITGNDTRH